MVHLTDEVYDNVVVPRKKAKAFTKLVESLLEGYYRNQGIQAYIDGVIENLEEESLKALDEAIAGIQGSMSRMGLLKDDLEDTVNEGVEIFAGGNGSVSKEEFNDLRSEFTEMKQQNEKILDMLKKMSSDRLLEEDTLKNPDSSTEESQKFDWDDLNTDMVPDDITENEVEASVDYAEDPIFDDLEPDSASEDVDEESSDIPAQEEVTTENVFADLGKESDVKDSEPVDDVFADLDSSDFGIKVNLDDVNMDALNEDDGVSDADYFNGLMANNIF